MVPHESWRRSEDAVPVWPLRALYHALHHGLPWHSFRPQVRFHRDGQHHVGMGYVLPAERGNRLLFPRRRAFNQNTADQDSRAGTKPLQYRGHHLQCSHAVYAESRGLELGQLCRYAITPWEVVAVLESPSDSS